MLGVIGLCRTMTLSILLCMRRHFRINWWKTPAESPDLNPIENLWHELKEFIRREVKPHTKDELIVGIKRFWKTVDVAKCTRFVLNLNNSLIT